MAGLTEAFELRDRYSKSYISKTPGHFITQIASRPIHFRDAQGRWKDIDTSLVPAGHGVLHTAANSFDLQVNLHQDAAALATLRFDASHAVGYGLAGAVAGTGTPTGASTVAYTGVEPGINVSLTSLPTELKENLVLTGADSPTSFTFPLQLDGLHAQIDGATGDVVYVDGAGTVYGSTPAATVEDANVDMHSGHGQRGEPVAYTVIDNADGSQALQLNVDSAWLRDPARIFPVTVDPIVQPQADFDDTWVTSGYTNDNSTSTEEQVGAFDTAGHVNRSFIHFNVGAVSGKIINSAQFYLFENHQADCTLRGMKIYRITSAWSGTSVQQFSTYAGGAAPGSPLLADVLGNFTTNFGDTCGGGHYIAPDATPAVRNWSTGAWAMDGIALVSDDESTDLYFKEFNSENSGQNVPLVNIDYSNPVAPNVPDTLGPANGAKFSAMPALSARYTDPNVPASAGTLQFRVTGPGGYVGNVDGIGQGCTSGCTGSWTPPAGADGTYSWYVYAHNGWGYNSANSSTLTFIKDGSAPAAPAVSSSSHPNQTLWYTNNSPTFTWSDSDTSGISNYSYTLDQNAVGDPGTTAMGTGTSTTFTGKADGTWYFHVRAQNGAGLWGAVATYTVNIDASGASLTITSSTHPDQSAWYSNNSPSLSWSATDAQSGIAGYTYSFDQNAAGDPGTAATVATTSAAYPNTPDGTWYLHVRAKNGAGVWTAVVSYAVHIDTSVASSLTITSSTHQDQSTWYSNNAPAFQWSATDPQSGIAGYTYSFDQNPAGDPGTAATVATTSATYPNTPDGTWYLHVRAENGAGAWTAVVSYTVHVDVTAPNGPATATTDHTVGQVSNNNRITATWTAGSDATSGVAGYAWAFNHTATTPAGTTITGGDATTLTATSTALTDGIWYFHVRTVDKAGNVSSDTAVGPFYIDTSMPTISKSVSPTVTATGQVATYTLHVTNTHNFAVNLAVGDNVDQSLTPYPNSITVDGASCTATTTPSCVLSGNVLSTSSIQISPNSSRDIAFQVVASGTPACDAVGNTGTATNDNGTSSATVSLNPCGAGLGLESWWTYVSRAAGPQATVAVNVNNGNLVLSQTDTAPVQAHGRLAYVLRRSYNSEDPVLVNLPGSWGAGWQLAIGQTDELLGGGVGASGLYVPSVESATNPGAVTLIDRDGTRHVFRPNGLAVNSVDVTTLALGTPSAQQALVPRVLPTAGVRVCADETFTPPPGVHVALWRYVEVRLVDSCGNLAAAPSPVVLGFAAERTDRVRYEFSADGHLLDMADGAGVEQRYVYDSAPAPAPSPLGNLRAVYEPRSCTTTNGSGPVTLASIPDTCRAFRFVYPSSTEADVYDPAGRPNDPNGRAPTKYFFDAPFPGLTTHLVGVTNPDGSTLAYTYGPNGLGSGSCPGASADQLCSARDPRGHNTVVAYVASGTAGLPPQVATLTDRRGTPTHFDYRVACTSTSPVCTIVHEGAQSQRIRRFRRFDTSGRTGEVESGNIDPIDQTEHYYHVVYTTWDGDRDPRSLDDPNHGVLPVITCRTDGVVDNDLCRQVVESMNDTETGKANGITTADGDTSWTYNPEGQHLTQRQRLQASSTGSASNVDSTWGYHAQYVGASATTTYDDTVAGGGAVTSPARSASALYVVSDQVQSLPPRGNAPGAAASSFRTDYRVDDATSAAPNSAASSACGQSNTGLVCEVDAPAATGASSPPGGRCAPAADRSTPYACTRFTYDAFGQRATAATPLAEAGSAPVAVTRYTYYGDGDTDLTGQVSAGGWLRAVADASANCAGSGCFVAFAYDRGGNQTRSWDRNATRGHAVTDGWTSLVSPPATAYAEVVRGTGATAYSAPWRYARSQRDQVADTTTVAVDANGNPTTTTPPRGTAAGSTSYDITSTYDANDNLASRKLPADSAAVQFTYDEFDNRSTEVDADGSTTLWLYDAVNRNNETRWSRSASAGDAVGACTVPAAGTAGASGLEGHVVCSTTRSFDGLDDVIVSADGNHQNTTFSYDSLGRQTDSFAPRDANTTEHTASVYDLDGNVVEVCSPRNFDPAAGNSTTCANGALYGRYATYDKADRMATATAYRDATTPITTGTSYDADGNVVSTTDGNNHTTTAVYDILDRRVSATTPRDANHHETTAWSYDAAGNVTAVSMPGSVDTGTGADGALVVDGASGTAPDGVPHPAANPYRIPTGKNYTAITLQNGGYATSAGSDLDVKATGSVVICSTCSLTVAGLGSAGGAGGSGSVVNGSAGQGPGAGGGGVSALTGGGGGGGGGHATGGTAGANSAGTGGAAGGAYGDAMTSAPTVSARGSGGGGGGGAVSAGGAGGAGGGYVRLQAATIDIEGAVSADGGAGVTGAGAAAGGGGGSGGGIWLTAPAITLGSATALSANGGMGGGGGGAGGLGRIRVDVDALSGAGASSVPPGTTAQTTRDLASRVTAYSYDAANRPIDTVSGAESLDATDPAQLATGGTNTRTRRAYDQDGNVVATFDARAFTASTSSPDPRFMARTDYDEDGRPTAQYVPRFDGSAASDTAGSSSAVQRNQCATGRAPQAVAGVPTWPADVGVCVSRVTYDGNGNITRITMPTAVGTGNRFITLTYFDDNLLKQVKPPSPATGAHDPAVTHVYDGDGRELQATDATLSDGSSLTTKTTYTLDGLVDTTSEWSGSTDLGHTFHYGYDADGHPTTSQDPKTYVTTTSYTVDGLVSSVKQPGATASDFDTTSYIYDSVGNATAITSPSGNAGDANNTAMTPTRNTYYDDNLLNTSTAPVASDGSTSKVSSYRYDAAGRKISQDVVALGQDAGTQTLSYLPNDRLASEVGRGGAERLDFGYDAAGDAVTASDQASSGQVGGTVAMTYYLDGLLRTAVDGTAGTGATTTALAYDGYGSPTYRSQTPAGGAALKTTYTYLDAELPSTLTSDVTGGQTSWTYKANGKVQTESDPNGESRSYTYNPDETLQSAALNVGTTNVATYSYSYDELQRVRSQSYTSAAANAGPFNGATYGYDYEPSGRLSSFSDSSGTSLVTWDHDGNRLKFGTKRSATYNADDTVKNDTRPDPTDPTGAATTTKLQVYDAARRLADDGCSTYTYDGLDRLSQVAPKTVRTACAPTTTTVGYRYDALDRQVSRAESGSPGAATETLHYDGSSEALDREASSATAGGAPLGTNTYELDAANSPKALTESKVGAKPLEYLTDDGMGNVATLTDATGAVDCDARYDPFGDAEQPAPANADPNCNAGSTPNDVFYHGARRDAATGDYQFGSRTYDPSKSAFLTPDSYRAAPSGGDLSVGIDPLTRNTYSFVNGDPVNLVDPTGHASSCGPNISPSMCRSNSEDFRHEAEVEEAQNFLRHCSYEQCRSERNSFVDDGYADVSPLAAPHKKKAGLLSGLWHGAVHAAKKAGAAVVAGVEYCLGKGARTCATVAAAVAIAATGVGALVEAGGLLAVGVASVAASEFLTGAAAFVSAAGIGASAGFAGAAYSKSHSLTEFIAPAGAVLGEFGPSLGGDPDPPAAEEGGGASSAADGARLSEHLRQLEEYGDTGFKELENGRIRYYGEIDPADKPGEMVGRRLVREWDPETGYRRTWHETVDQSGRVRIVRPETGGPKVHYFFDEYGNYEGSW